MSIIFDYLSKETNTKVEERVEKQIAMADSAGEAMLAKYSYKDIEKILSDNEILIYEHLEPKKITQQYFKEYNLANLEYPMTAFDNVNYCLGVKKKF